jgi:hypothetical protein
MAELPPPPPGFEIDQASIPPPPPGFEIPKTADGATKIDLHYLTPQDRASNAVSSITGSDMAGAATGMAIKSALPMAGSIIGMSLIGIPGDPIGAAIGTIANQALGIEEPSIAAIGLAMAAGPVARTGMMVGKSVLGAALKAGGGREVVSGIAEKLTERLFNPIVSSDELFAAAAQKANVPIPAFNTARSIADTLAAEAKRADTPIKQSILKALNPLKNFYQNSAPGAGEIATEAKRLRLMSKEAFNKGNPDLGNALSNVRNSMFDDAARSGVPELRAAATTYRREAAIEDLQGVMRQHNPLKHYEDLKDKNALFRGVFSKTEQKQIEHILKQMSTVSPSGVMGRLLTTVGGQQVGGWKGAVAGFIAPEIAAKVISTGPGRKFMEHLLIGGKWDEHSAAALGQYWRAQYAEDAQSGDVFKRVQAMLKDSNTSVDEKISAAAMRTGIIEAAKTEEGQSWGLGIEIDKFLNKLQPVKDK